MPHSIRILHPSHPGSPSTYFVFFFFESKFSIHFSMFQVGVSYAPRQSCILAKISIKATLVTLNWPPFNAPYSSPIQSLFSYPVCGVFPILLISCCFAPLPCPHHHQLILVNGISCELRHQNPVKCNTWRIQQQWRTDKIHPEQPHPLNKLHEQFGLPLPSSTALSFFVLLSI